jgi:4-aminobutyrate aminotransferase
MFVGIQEANRTSDADFFADKALFGIGRRAIGYYGVAFQAIPAAGLVFAPMTAVIRIVIFGQPLTGGSTCTSDRKFALFRPGNHVSIAMQRNLSQLPPQSSIDEHQERSEGDTNRSQFRAEYQDRYVDEATRGILAEDSRYFLHQSLSTPCIDAIASAEGIYLYDVAGRRIMDFHGNGVHHVGFRHPRVVEAVKSQMDRLPFCTRRYTNEVAVALARKLAELTPDPLGKVLFAPGGTNAMGMALKLARLATRRHKTISMWGSFHGASMDVIAVGGQTLFSDGLGPLMPGAIHIRPPISTDCPFRCGLDCDSACADYVRHIMENERDIAAVVAEPIRWSTVTIPPREYWRKIRKFCDEFGAILIFDEIGTGLGRTGKMFAFEHFEIVPDIVVLGKGFGGGIMPLAGIIARTDLDLAGDRAIGHYTHEKNPVSCAAGLATIDIIERDQLLQRCVELGAYLVERLTSLQARFPFIRRVRGLGLLVGVELADDSRAGPSQRIAEWVMYRAMAKGLSFKVSSGNVITLVPPLVITAEQLDDAITILTECFSELQNHLRHDD